MEKVSKPSFFIPPSLYGEGQAGTPQFSRSSSEDFPQDMTLYLLTLKLTDFPTFCHKEIPLAGFSRLAAYQSTQFGDQGTCEYTIMVTSRAPFIPSE